SPQHSCHGLYTFKHIHCCEKVPLFFENCSLTKLESRDDEMSKQSFLRGTFILIAAGFITKLLGFVNKIVVARIMGDEGVGLYMMAVPTFILAVTLTRLGLPVAISKMVAEADAVNDTKKIKKILVISLATTSVLSVVWTCGLL